MDELGEEGLTPRQNLLITELVATLLLASNARPAPISDADRARAYRERRDRHERHVTRDDTSIIRDNTSSSELENKNKKQTNTPTKARASRLRDDWEPSLALIEWARRKEYTPEFITYETERFRNWAFGRGAARSDWDACWRNWLMRNWEERKPQQRKSGMAEALDRVVERARQHDAGTRDQGNVVDLSEIRQRGESISGAPCDTEPSS